MRSLIPVAAATLSLAVAGPASACLEIVGARDIARAFKEADLVVSVEGVTEDYVAVPATQSLRVGVGTGRVVEVFKGRAPRNGAVTYRVVDGEIDGDSCPGRRYTRPGHIYKLYLKYLGDHGPPIILLPTDLSPPKRSELLAP